MSKQYLDKSGLAYFWSKLKAYFQEKLVSGTNIKTVNGVSLLGSGDVPVSGGSGTITRVKTTAGAHTAIDVSSGAANFNVPTAAAHVGAVADCTIGLYNGQGGNPGACKFCTVDYSSCDSNNGVLVKITMMAGHGNGTSYNHYQDAIISVSYTGAVSVNIYRYYAQSITYESTTHYFGDIFYTIDIINKVVTFYDLMGQYSYMYQAPYKKMNGSGRGTVTQLSGTAVHYSSGTKTYANIFWMDGRTKQNTLVSGTNIKTVNSNSLLGSGNVSVGTVTGVTAGTGLSGGGSSGSVTLNHSNSITAGTIGSSDTSLGSAVRIPYATYDSNGHITGKGEHTHVITGFLEGSSGTSGSTGITMGLWKLIWGDETMTTSSASGSGTFAAPYYVDTTLYVSFSATPYVWCEVNGNFTGTRYANAYDVTQTGFTIRLFASAKNSAVTHVRWFALGRA